MHVVNKQTISINNHSDDRNAQITNNYNAYIVKLKQWTNISADEEQQLRKLSLKATMKNHIFCDNKNSVK